MLRSYARLGSSTALRQASAFRLAGANYHSNVIDHYENPRNVGSLDKDDPEVGTAIVGAPACGDVMKVQIKVKDGQIIDSKFKVKFLKSVAHTEINHCSCRRLDVDLQSLAVLMQLSG